MGEVLRKGAQDEIREYQRRFSAAAGLYDHVLSPLVLQKPDHPAAREAAKRFFGSDRARFAAVDGTDHSKEMFNLVVFFGGSYAATGTVLFGEEGVSVEYDQSHLADAKGICSCVPIYVSEVAEIDHSLLGEGEEITAGGALTDEEIITNSEIANRIMTFSEFYLAYKLAIREQDDIRIIFLDRTISGEISSLIYDTSNRRRWTRSCSMIGYPVEGVPVDVNELHYSRHHLRNWDLNTLPPRGDYLIYSILHYLEGGRKADLKEICRYLGLESQDRVKRARGRLARLKREGMIGDILGSYRMASRYEGYWNRMRKLVLEIGEAMFGEEGERGGSMTVSVGGESRYLTTMDLAFLTLFTINLLIEECWSRGILLIGITKDTAARDFKRHVLPLLSNIGALREKIEPQTYEHIPNTDRMFLQAASLMNHEGMQIPWALFEYDSAMRTLVHDPGSGPRRVMGAIRNKIIPERLVLKTYMQLAQAQTDPRLRSNVILVDRLAHPGFDAQEHQLMEFQNEYGSAVEPVRVILPGDASRPSELQVLTACMLSGMTSSDVPELFGHNKPLFIADKVAKWNNECFRRMVETTATWIKSNPEIRDFVFYMSSFRERRSAVEYTRRE